MIQSVRKRRPVSTASAGIHATAVWMPNATSTNIEPCAAASQDTRAILRLPVGQLDVAQIRSAMWTSLALTAFALTPV